MSDSFGDAISHELDMRSKSDKMNEAVLATLPVNPPRCSFEWWARVCRQNTGQHFLDSGGAYGRKFEQPVPPKDIDPIVLEFHDGDFEGATISTIHWLTANTDTSDESEALQAMLEWCSTWLYPRESWAECLDSFFKKDLQWLISMVQRRWRNQRESFILRRKDIHARLTEQAATLERYDKLTFQRDLSDAEYVTQAMKGLPGKAIKLIADECRNDRIEIENGFNVYNSENDFDQVFQADSIKIGWNYYATIQTHNGCDVRGGYSDPVIVDLKDDGDGFYDWNVEFYCPECNFQSEMGYFYNREREKKFGKVVTHEKIEEWRKTLEVMDAIKTGQSVLPGFTPSVLYEDEAIVRATISAHSLWIEAGSEGDFKPPCAMLELEDGKVEAIGGEGFAYYPASQVLLICPDCGAFTVRASAMGL